MFGGAEENNIRIESAEAVFARILQSGSAETASPHRITV
jgi:hypothetical protein